MALQQISQFHLTAALAATVTFAPALAGQTITVSSGWNDADDDTALRVGSNVIVDGGTGVTIHLVAATPRRIFLNGGTLNVVDGGGKVMDVLKLETGKAIWLDADKAGTQHADVNPGTTAVEVIVVQLKNDKPKM